MNFLLDFKPLGRGEGDPPKRFIGGGGAERSFNSLHNHIFFLIWPISFAKNNTFFYCKPYSSVFLIARDEMYLKSLRALTNVFSIVI